MQNPTTYEMIMDGNVAQDTDDVKKLKKFLNISMEERREQL
jgi:hypothetical protein